MSPKINVTHIKGWLPFPNHDHGFINIQTLVVPGHEHVYEYAVFYHRADRFFDNCTKLEAKRIKSNKGLHNVYKQVVTKYSKWMATQMKRGNVPCTFD